MKNETIRKRKSIRKYDPTPLDEATLAKVREQIARLVPLYPDIRYSVEIVGKRKRGYGLNAPHYLVFCGEGKDGTDENIGFIGQQMDLYFSENGLGSCWVGMAKPEGDEGRTLPFVICMAFGKPAEPLQRGDVSEFARKPLTAISEGEDERLEAARLAPSAANGQNWYFIAEKGKIHCYTTKSKNPLLKAMLSGLARIDIGIAIWHIAAESEGFRFRKELDVPERKGCTYVGTVVPS
ncbi:MAG: nitroreductase [Lachnospiraceae bacterium]|jgi:nitroreductase|nr:nitroreductase [Lachnospiraceae bacterium]